ncbi:hypothetical protein HQ496_10920 [bacterium]|nr:hypothetical protein [bacterium]
MKKYSTALRKLSVAILMAVFTLVALPHDSMAQRTRTDKGKVTVNRGKAGSAGKARSAGKATSAGKSDARKADARKSDARKSDARKSDARKSNAEQSATRGSNSTRSQNASGSRGGARVDRDAKQAGSRSTGSGARSTNGSSARRATDAGRVGGKGNQDVIRGNRSSVVVPRRIPVRAKNGNRTVRYAPRFVLNVGSKRAYRPQSRISIHVSWPWVLRYERHWSPRYRYRQVVYVESNWGSRNRSSRIEMETVYRHKVRYATDDYAVLDIEIEEVALYEGNRYLGKVDRIPRNLSQIEATVFRDGQITFDRDVFLVGDRRAGFEMISTKFYDDYALAKYRASDGYRVGVLNLRSESVRSVSRSRLFDPRDYNGFAPISLLPEDEGWLWDYGVEAISAASDDYDAYYGYEGGNGRAYRSESRLNASAEYSYGTDFGAQYKIKRESNIQRVE